MTNGVLVLAGEYLAILKNYLVGLDEAALQQAYQLGRKALSQGYGVVHIASVHHESLASVLRDLPNPESGAETTRHAALVEAESLSVFEMAQRGYREANGKLLRLNAELKEKNDKLEELTEELEETAMGERRARLDLQKAHDSLKHTQAQLVQSAKLAALGQLVAGVAHEINNPLAFVLNNFAVLQRDLGAVQDILRLYQQLDSAPADKRSELSDQARAYAEEIDLPYTVENLCGLLQRAHDGLKRIQRIVEDLRGFARQEEDQVHHVDLNPGIQSTINILAGRAAKKQVRLETSLGSLPRLTCNPSKINQVVLNLVANAIDACSAERAVKVETRGNADGVEIHVSDDGPGIPAAIRDKIFDPFFTTKPPGQGTGLGLSICHGIVEEHGGRIELISPERGAHFIVFLPVRNA